MESLCDYSPVDEAEAEKYFWILKISPTRPKIFFKSNLIFNSRSIIERILPRIGHNNSSVVFSASKLVLKLSDSISKKETIKLIGKKISSALGKQG
jgi:hypothetical protein